MQIHKLIAVLAMVSVLFTSCDVIDVSDHGSGEILHILSSEQSGYAGDADSSLPTQSLSDPENYKTEQRGVWISYYELGGMFESKEGFKKAFDSTLDRLGQMGINTVYVHCRAFCDSFYRSDVFPWAKHISGTQGTDPGFDPLEYMVSSSHKRNIGFHAWLNPYRVMSEYKGKNELSDKSPAKRWMTDSDPANDDWVIAMYGGLYLNPAYKGVQKLIVDGVREIISGYKVDGIHFDDYFYPDGTDDKFDEKAYADYLTEVSGSPLSLGDWRRANVNAVLSAVSRAVKQDAPGVLFSVSPAGNIEYNYSEIYADVNAWIGAGIVDFIIPQIYFGFEYKKEKYRYDRMLGDWLKLVDGRVPIYIGLAAYKIGTSGGDDADEWMKKDDILSRQILLARQRKAGGIVLFSASSVLSQDKLNRTQIENIVPLLR